MHYLRKPQISDLEMNADAHVSHFGALKTASTIPVIKGNFPGSSLDEAVWKNTSSNGGNITVERGVGRLFTSTNSAGSIKLLSVKKVCSSTQAAHGIITAATTTTLTVFRMTGDRIQATNLLLEWIGRSMEQKG